LNFFSCFEFDVDLNDKIMGYHDCSLDYLLGRTNKWKFKGKIFRKEADL